VKGLTIGMLSGALLAGALFVLFRPAARVGLENGVFTHDCCGTLELRDGAMILNSKQTVRYDVGRDARGPYILPRTYVGPFEDTGFEVDGSRAATKLRLDRLPQPTRILLYEGVTPYAFAAKHLPVQPAATRR
jgi:hypothetical protein